MNAARMLVTPPIFLIPAKSGGLAQVIHMKK
jgi:hypothetical protein